MTARAILAAVAVSAAGAVLARSAAAAPQSHEPQTPIKHVVSLMQENHSFDNYFGTYPGADGLPSAGIGAGDKGGVCMPVNPLRGTQPCVKPFHIGNKPILDLGHSHLVFEDQYDGGKLDGFVSSGVKQGLGVTPNAMGYYDHRDLPFYWNIADEYVLFDRFFTSASAGSVQNHMFWVTGRAGNADDIIPPGGFNNITTIFDRLEKAGVSWKFYVQNYHPDVTYRSLRSGDIGAQPVWVPLLDYARYLDDPKLFGHIVDLSEYYRDLDRGTLPAVSYIVPSGASEHPPGSVRAGQRFVRTLINSLMQSSAWKSSAFTWSYDDWGGWYDHVKPPQVDQFGYGFRAPALLVSPYARRGFIDHTTLDFTSVLKFIEQNWNLRPLAQRDKRANSIATAFDFSQAPREARLLPSTYGTAIPAERTKTGVYILYGVGLALALAVLGAAVIRSRRPPSPEPEMADLPEPEGGPSPEPAPVPEPEVAP